MTASDDLPPTVAFEITCVRMKSNYNDQRCTYTNLQDIRYLYSLSHIAVAANHNHSQAGRSGLLSKNISIFEHIDKIAGSR